MGTIKASDYLEEFRKEESELFDLETGELYTGVYVSKRQCELMRNTINDLDKVEHYKAQVKQ